MIMHKVNFKHHNMLPYNGTNLEFLSKNLKLPVHRVFEVLSVIDLSAEDFVSFLVNERLKNRERHITNYTVNLFRK